MAKKIELLHTTYDESGSVESQEVVHPLTSPDCIVMENGKTLDEVMGDGIATPTLTHEGTSFKVGVGDSNIEVVDGDVAGMTLKGQSYQNILPKPTTLIMETDEQEFKINDKIDSNIIIDDNIAEIATVKGKTIVNAVQEESASEYTVLGEDLSGQSIAHVKEMPTLEGQTLVNLAGSINVVRTQHIEVDKVGYVTITNYSNYQNYFTKKDSVKPSTKYLIIVDIEQWENVEYATSDGLEAIFISSNHNESNNCFPQITILRANIGKGIYKFITTSKDDLSNVNYGLRTFTYIKSGTIKYRIMLIEYQDGMENWDIPYFEGTKTFESNIKGITLQGQTLVNTIQEPCKDDYVVLGADDGIEISAKTGGCGTIEDTVQGGINGAVLEGNTLVNLVKKLIGENVGYGNEVWLPQGSGQVTYSYDVDKGITLSNAVNGSMVLDYLDLTLFKTNTEYTLFIDVNWNGVGVIPHFTGVTTKEMQLNNGLNIIKFTTVSDLTVQYMCLRLGYSGEVTVGCEYTFNNIMVLEGDWTNVDIPYFEGMQSVKQPVLTTTGKNLFDYKSYGGQNIGIVEIENGLRVSKWSLMLPFTHNLLPNTKYTSKAVVKVVEESVGATDIGTGKIMMYNGTNYLPLFAVNGREYAFTTPSDIKSYDRILFYAHGGGGSKVGVVDITNIQLEEDSTATSYEPYKLITVTTSKIQLTEAMLEQGSVDEKKPVGTLYVNMKNTSESAEYYKTRIRTATTYKVKPNTDYQVKLNNNYRSFIVCFNDGKYMSHITWNTQGTRTFTVPSNCNEIALVFCLVNGASISVSEFSNMGVELVEALTLRKIGDVKDEFDLTTGKLTQRIGEVVLDGSEDEAWLYGAGNSNETIALFYLKLDDDKNYKPSINDKLPSIAGYGVNFGEGIYVDADINIRVDCKKLNAISISDFKQWLSQNPITVQYKLATELVKTVNLTITDQDGKTFPHIQTQPTVTHITASSDYLIPTVTIDNNLAYDTIIKPSTPYTIRFKHDTVNADNPLTVDLGGTVQTVTSTEFTITTPSELTHNQLVFSGKNNVVSEVQVIEGDVTNIEYPFFEGMNDVRFIHTTRNVNLFDINDTVSGYFNVNGGIESPDFGNLISNYIKVKPNTTYVYNHGGFVANFADYWTAIKFYKDDKGSTSTVLQDTTGTVLDKNGKAYYIGGGRYTVTGKTGYNTFQFTTPSDCEYIRIGSRGLSYSGAWATLYQLDNFDDSKFIARNCPFIFGKGGRI